MLFGAQEPSPRELLLLEPAAVGALVCCGWGVRQGRGALRARELARPRGLHRYQVLPIPNLKWILGSLVLSRERGKGRTGTCGFMLATVLSILDNPDISHLINSCGKGWGFFASKATGKEKNPEFAKAN